MDLKRFKEPAFLAAALCCVLVLILITLRSQSTSSSPEARDVRPQFEQLHKSIKETESRLASLEATIAKLLQENNQQIDSLDNDAIDSIELFTKDDAEKRFAELGETPSAHAFAETLSIVDGWLSKPEDSDTLRLFKSSKVAKLRQLVKQDVESLHEQALKAETGAKSAELYARASQALALYPMDSINSVLDEARSLSARHSDVGIRIEVIRRQRYNAWAMDRIEETIKAINSIASSFRTADNPKTIDATVQHLGEVDPTLLEPVVAQLYNYAVEQAKSNINSEQQLELGRRIIDPAIKRKNFGDF